MWSGTESNRRHGDFQSPALPTELPDHALIKDKSYLFGVANMSIIKKLFILIFFSAAISASAETRPDYAPRESAAFYLKRGELQFDAAMYDYAYESMILSLKADPRNYGAANILGRLFLLQKDYHNAGLYFDMSLSIEDNQPEIHNAAGELKEYVSSFESAHNHYLKAATQNPEYTEALINLSRSFFRKGEKEDAEKFFRSAYNSSIGKSLPLYREAEALPDSRHKEKESLLKEAIKINPAHLEAYMALATIMRLQNNYGSAVEILEKLKSVKPDYTPAYLHLGNIYFTKRLPGNTREYFLNLAIANYTKAVELDPQNSETYFHLSSLYRHMGNRGKAAEMEQKGLDLQR